MLKSLCLSFLLLTSLPEMMWHVQNYQADHQLIQRKYPLKRSPFYLQRAEEFYKDWLNKLQQLNYSNLSTSDKIDYTLLKRNISTDLENIQKEAQDFKKYQLNLHYLNGIIEFEKIRRVGDKPDPKVWETKFKEIGQQIEKSTTQFKQNTASIESSFQINWLLQTSNQYASTFKEAYKFYEGYDPAFTAASREIVKQIYEAFDQHQKYLSTLQKNWRVGDDGSGILGNPIGEKAFQQLLEKEMIAYSPLDLEKIALREFEWCEKEMIKASQEMGFGKDWKKALEQVKQAYPALGEQPELVYDLAQEAISFIETQGLIKIPALAKEGWRMRMLSPQEQLFAPFFLGGESVLIAYPHESMSAEAQLMTLRGNNRHFSRAVVHHELIPGHNLQYFMQSRYNTYRRAFDTPFWTEGWSLYWEMLLWDKGFAKSPEDRIGMLFWRMHRCARILFSMNYHLNKWTPKECIDFLVDKVGFERANAEAEVRRSFTGGYGPLYQIGYMLGGLQFRALKEEIVDSGRMTFIDFHETILKQNAMPVEMLRSYLLNSPPSENYKTNWKFAGALE